MRTEFQRQNICSTKNIVSVRRILIFLFFFLKTRVIILGNHSDLIKNEITRSRSARWVDRATKRINAYNMIVIIFRYSRILQPVWYSIYALDDRFNYFPRSKGEASLNTDTDRRSESLPCCWTRPIHNPEKGRLSKHCYSYKFDKK